MTEQQPPKDADEVETVAAPEATASYAEWSRRQHLRAALSGRPIMFTAAAIAALVVGLGGFGIGYAVGNHHDRGDRFGRVVFEPGQWREGPGGQAPPGWNG